MHRILLIDDDKKLAVLLREYFSQFDLVLDSAAHPTKGIAQLAQQHYDLVVLDIMLPEMDGFEVCKKIRHTSNIPIIMLSARGEVMDRIIGIELGADDYLPKPFEPRELVVRIQSVLKRFNAKYQDTEVVSFGDLKVDKNLRKVLMGENEISISAMEYQLLLLFIRSPGKTLSRDEILNHLKGVETDLYSRAVDVLVSRLRNKLAPLNLIKTVRGQGYVFTGTPS